MGSAIISIYTFLNGKYLLDNLYNHYLISGGLRAGFTISKLLDKGIIELIGPFGLTSGSYSASHSLSKLDTGVITTYALYITLGLISILFILFSPLFFNAFPADINEHSSAIMSTFPSTSIPTELGNVSNNVNPVIDMPNNIEQGLKIEMTENKVVGSGVKEEIISFYTLSVKILLLSVFTIFLLLGKVSAKNQIL